MNNNRYNLRSSAQQPVASSFYPNSSTGTTATGGGMSTTTTSSTTGLSSSSSILQPQQFPAQQSQQEQQQQQQQYFFADAQTQAQANTNNTIPTHYQPGQMPGLGGPAATAPFLQDFTLVAEAVKRVQMDAVMTEMESITL